MELSQATTLPDGTAFTIRPTTTQDAKTLGEYFLGLSEQTKSTFGPHPFNQTTADKFCAEINLMDTIRFIGLVPRETQDQVIAYFILQMGIPEYELTRYQQLGITLNPLTDCLVAPSVADAYQNQGVGSITMLYLFDSARSMGRKHILLMGGVYMSNKRAVHFYQKMGFIIAGTFLPSWDEEQPSYDMYKVL